MPNVLAPLIPEDAQTLADRAYGRLREAIVDGTLASGAKLSERGLAAALAISAQPIREALRRLEGEGMVESRLRSGTYVAKLDAARLVEMGRVRVALEGVTAGLVARRATVADVAALRARVAAIRVATELGDAGVLAAANDAFHTALHAATGNAFLIRSLHALRAYYHISAARVLGGRGEPPRALAEHAAVVDAIANGDPDAAEALMRAHTLRSLLAAFPEAG